MTKPSTVSVSVTRMSSQMSPAVLPGANHSAIRGRKSDGRE